MNQIELDLAKVNRNELPKRSEKEIEILAQELLAKMTLKEKIGQLVQSGTDCSEITGPGFDSSSVVENIKNGMVGSILGTADDRFSFNLQQKALESRLGIPLMFCADIIHGCRTSFPVNLAMSGSFDLKLVEESMKVAAYEAAHSGVDLVFSPMLDLVRDPRWGRVMESNGEDPFLSSKLAKAYVKGYLSSAKNALTDLEKELLPWGAKIMTYECGIRFLMDYLNGDVYFHTEYPEHNLVRARTQFALVADMEKKMDKMLEITKKYC